MLPIAEQELDAPTLKELQRLQKSVDRLVTYAEQVAKAETVWISGRGSKASKSAFTKIRETLSTMCIGPVRCSYCEDSGATDIEHIFPKSLFPERAFLWGNYLYACSGCNGPKSNQFGYLFQGGVVEFKRVKNAALVPPPAGISALIDPRLEHPTRLLDLDLGGVAADGTVISGTFMFLAKSGISAMEKCRAEFTINTLGLNREIVRVARKNAFGGFRARLREYVQELNQAAVPEALERLRSEIIGTPHLTVFFEMRRQRNLLPEIDQIFAAAPDTVAWDLTVK